MRQPMVRRLRSGRRLPFHPRRGLVHASPRRCAHRPDRHRRLRELRIVERADPYEDQMGPRLGLAEQRSAAARAEAAVHPIAAVGHARVVARRPGDLEGCRAKASADGPAACAEVLAIPAPADPRGDWRLGALPTNRAAKATACHCHVCLQDRDGAVQRLDSRVCRLSCKRRAVPRKMTPAGPSRGSPS